MTNAILVTRRTWLATLLGAIAGGTTMNALLSVRGYADIPSPHLTVYKDPACGCCTNWIAHLRQSGFVVTANDRHDMDALKDSLGVPAALRSCHTGVAGRYLIEGHVPASDIKRLLATATRNTLGLAVPGMPSGSPGMEISGRSDQYDVIAFGAGGTSRVFASHG